ncbi:MAG: fimbrillin family protein, partial [Bacteroidaceae bacterium]|nr:fimbrillin family protein [Bacteroidaceae bacterium]
MNILKNSWRKGTKLLSQLLCIGAVLTACTDDEVTNQSDKAPLQVSVNTSLAKQSRAIVHGEWLPSGSTIGVSLFTPEGDDYDEQGYYNIQYKGMGVEEDQVWSSMGVTPAVSANEAVLVAYHPYNDDEDLDITAIPVEIATQTDYMYSGPVTGVTNAAPKVDIVLDHALTAIRVKLVLGDFTGDASVSEIAVASPALAS